VENRTNLERNRGSAADVICQSQSIDWFISRLSQRPAVSREQSGIFELGMRGDRAIHIFDVVPVRESADVSAALTA
jgi:hypothetical protein